MLKVGALVLYFPPAYVLEEGEPLSPYQAEVLAEDNGKVDLEIFKPGFGYAVVRGVEAIDFSRGGYISAHTAGGHTNLLPPKEAVVAGAKVAMPDGADAVAVLDRAAGDEGTVMAEYVGPAEDAQPYRSDEAIAEQLADEAVRGAEIADEVAKNGSADL
jgi:hypothetical protein